MKPTAVRSILSALACSLVCGAAFAVPTVSVTASDGTLYQTTGIDDLLATGASMAGMRVTACFSVGPCETIDWAATGASEGGAVGTGWSVTTLGDTFNSIWQLRNAGGLTITSLEFQGRFGNTAFDDGSLPDTPGSSLGRMFEWVSDDGGLNSMNVEYFDALALVGDAPRRDLYLGLRVLLNGGTGYDGEWAFKADTDLATTVPVVVPPPVPMPLPGTLALTGGALLALGTVLRRRRA